MTTDLIPSVESEVVDAVQLLRSRLPNIPTVRELFASHTDHEKWGHGRFDSLPVRKRIFALLRGEFL